VPQIEVTLPHFWRRMDAVHFEPASSFADVFVGLPPRKRIARELRARGYTVTEASSRSTTSLADHHRDVLSADADAARSA
jgi:hypothetical protein